MLLVRVLQPLIIVYGLQMSRFPHDMQQYFLQWHWKYLKYKIIMGQTLYLDPHRLYLHNLLPHHSEIPPVSSGSCHADIDRHRWILDQS